MRLLPHQLLMLTFALGLGNADSLWGQISVTAVEATDVSNGTATVDGVFFEGMSTNVTTFYTFDKDYRAEQLADEVFIRRNTTAGNANQSSVWYADGVNPANRLDEHTADYGALLLGNSLNSGSDNTFANGTGAAEGDIERLDFIFTDGLVVDDDLAFAVFDRGAAGVHDAFKIAVITGWDSGLNVPTSYSVLVAQAANWGGESNPVDSFGYRLFRYDTGDTLSTTTDNTESGTQGIGGVTFRGSELGVTIGQTIYGYSLFGFDVDDGGNVANLLDWTNPTYYPTTTTGETGTGGIDLASINGVAFSFIPEPASFGVFAVLTFGFFYFNRSRGPRAGLAA